MKSNNGLQIIIRITVCVTMLSSLIGAFMLHSTPSHRESGSVLILVSVAAAVLWVLEEVVFHNHTRKYVAKLSTMISKTERDSLLNFPAPAIIIDSENVIVWYNRLFGRQVYSEEEAYGIDLTELMNIDMDKIYSSDGDLVSRALASWIRRFAMYSIGRILSFLRKSRQRCCLVTPDTLQSSSIVIGEK